MSKRNSREEKSRRREKLAKKRAKFNNPCPRPEEYIKHFGFIPNEPYFHNAALAWEGSDMRFAIRTKEQLVEYAEREETKWLGSTSGKKIAYVSIFHTGGKESDLRDSKNITTEVEDFDYSSQQYLYLFRDRESFAIGIGSKAERKSLKEWERVNPFFNELNTFCLTKKDIKNLPAHRTHHSEITELAKKDEEYNAMREEELDRFLADKKESVLRKHYVFEEGGLVIDEFEGREGTTLFQPKKTEESWKVMGFSIPINVTKKGTLMVAELEGEPLETL